MRFKKKKKEEGRMPPIVEMAKKTRLIRWQRKRKA